jgi:hypothetical protein
VQLIPFHICILVDVEIKSILECGRIQEYRSKSSHKEMMRKRKKFKQKLKKKRRREERNGN